MDYQNKKDISFIDIYDDEVATYPRAVTYTGTVSTDSQDSKVLIADSDGDGFTTNFVEFGNNLVGFEEIRKGYYVFNGTEIRQVKGVTPSQQAITLDAPFTTPLSGDGLYVIKPILIDKISFKNTGDTAGSVYTKASPTALSTYSSTPLKPGEVISFDNSSLTPFVVDATATAVKLSNAFFFDITASNTGGLVSGRYLISGGAEWSGTDYVYDVSTLTYMFNGIKQSLPTQVTLNEGDATYDRIDAIVVNEAGDVAAIEGIPAENPLTPTIQSTELLVQYIIVTAGTTAPVPNQDVVYQENLEWTVSKYQTSVVSDGTVDADYATDPKSGVKCIEANALLRQSGIKFLRSGAIDVNEYLIVSIWVKLKTAVATNKSLNLRFYNNNTAVGLSVNLFNHGIIRTTLNTWQLAVVPTSVFSTTGDIDNLRLIMAGGSGANTYDVDNVMLSDGSAPIASEMKIVVQEDGVTKGYTNKVNFIGATVTSDTLNSRVDVRIIGEIYITKTKSEIDTLITASELVKGALYKITGVHTDLYNDGTNSGTTIYLKAIENNQLEVQGMGKFYNPKYNQAVDGFGIWDNKMYGTFANIVGVFDYQNKEAVTANNAATGILLADGMIQWVSGDWSAATSITGDVSGATADIAGFVSPSYGVGDKVIWGGYSWTNVNGNIGASVDVLNLDAEWTKNVYDTTNYNIAYDLIEYDYANDMIIRRFEKESNVDVKCSKAQYDFFVSSGFYHSISVQQFGNVYNASSSKGQLNILCDNGYNESINFIGANQYNLTFCNGAFQRNLTFGFSAYQYNLTFGFDANQQDLTFGSGAYQYNLTFGSGAYQSYLTFGNGVNQNNLTFCNGAYQYNLTFCNGAFQRNLTFGFSAYQYNLTFGNGAYQENLTFAENTQLNYNYQTLNSNMEYVSFRTKTVTIPDLSAATYIFDGNIKEVYQRPDGALKIKFMNDSDVMIVTDINV